MDPFGAKTTLKTGSGKFDIYRLSSLSHCNCCNYDHNPDLAPLRPEGLG